MVTTCKSYIEEYRLFDDVFDCLNEASHDLDVAVGNYNMRMHQLKSKMFFESSSDMDYEAIMEAESQGILAKIGTAVMTLVQKVSDFIKKITEKITGNIKLGKSDEEKVNQILAQHPELKDQVVEGIDKEWFTVSDVAKFEKDVVGLIQMLNKEAIDHQTFMDRFKAACKRFTDSAAPILGATTTVLGFMKIVPEIHKHVKGTRDTITAFNETAKKFGQDVTNNYAEKDVSKANAIAYAIKQAIGLTTAECKHQVESQNKIRNVFRWIGRKVTLDTDKSKGKAQQKVEDERNSSETREAARRNARAARNQRIKEKQEELNKKGNH